MFLHVVSLGKIYEVRNIVYKKRTSLIVDVRDRTKMKKTYVLDTNVLLSDATSLFSFQENDLIIPLAVLEELDRHKSRQDDVGKNARVVSRSLDELRPHGSLMHGVTLRNGGTLKIVSITESETDKLPSELQAQKVDNMIIAFMLTESMKAVSAVLVTNDINVRIKCDALNIKCEAARKSRVVEDVQKFYRGVEVIELDVELIDKFYVDGKLDLPADVLKNVKLYPNQIVVIKNVDSNNVTVQSAITKCVEPGKPLIPINRVENVFGLKPRNKEQNFSLDLLFDNDIKLMSLVGPAGCGKTLLALAAALEQLKGIGEHGTYDKLIVSRPVQPLGKDIGYLPGTLAEKMEPWIAPIRDNLGFLVNNRKHREKPRKGSSEQFSRRTDENSYLALMQERGLIEIEAITFIRGRSIPNAIIIIDEAQNLSMHELKTIITRAGEGTKIILTGDIEQIDNPHLDQWTNGLTYAVEKFKTQKIAGHVTLLKGERSTLATLAAEIM